jgi:hypothetical protein
LVLCPNPIYVSLSHVLACTSSVDQSGRFEVKNAYTRVWNRFVSLRSSEILHANHKMLSCTVMYHRCDRQGQSTYSSLYAILIWWKCTHLQYHLCIVWCKVIIWEYFFLSNCYTKLDVSFAGCILCDELCKVGDEIA